MSNIKTSFADFGLNKNILSALKDMGYEKPSPIQLACIPYLLEGNDVLGMAQTGSGKTAAFFLPLLNNIDLKLESPQILVLAPTRELAVQVTGACNDFAKHMRGVNVLALYGGQRYDIQLKGLRQGPQIVVGTPGRLLDHLKRGTLNLSQLRCLVLDEADEMLRMGFIEDVETIMSNIPSKRQTVLFSATMPEEIRRITRRFMKEPHDIRIQSNITTRPNISQYYWYAYSCKKAALLSFLEAEDFDAAIVFVRTKNMTLELAEFLYLNGYKCAALNGDMNQIVREKTLERFKNGNLDILIATDVAARGLDVERISLVINYDIPLDVESYIHRIGRTGRAGRAGRALLFVERRERRLLYNIERSIKSNIKEVRLPNTEFLSERRQEKFVELVQHELLSKDIEQYNILLKKISEKKQIAIEALATALLKMAQGKRPLIVPPDKPIHHHKHQLSHDKKANYKNIERRKKSGAMACRKEMELYRIDVGRHDGVEIRHIVGIIANEVGIKSSYIGNIKLFDSHAIIELPKNIPIDIFKNCARTRILNKPMNIKLLKNKNTYQNNSRRR